MRAAVIGLLIAALSSFLVWQYMRRFEEEASGGPRVHVLTVLRTLEPGAVLKDSDIGERSIPQAYVDSRAIRVADRQRISNLHVATALDAAQVLTWSDIVSASDPRVPSSTVQAPMRLVTIHTEGKSSSPVRAGDRVDVIATLPQPGSTDNRVATVLLQNVLVLGRSSGGDSAMANSANEGGDVALSLTLQQAQLLAVASDKAKLSLALRSIADNTVLSSLQQIPSDSIIDAKPKAAAPQVKTGPVPVGGAK